MPDLLRPRRLAAALLTAVLVVAPACGGDDDDDAKTGDGTTTTTAREGFQPDVEAALGVMVQALTEAIPVLQNWRDGKADQPTVTLAMDRVAAEANKLAPAIAGLKTGNGEERTAQNLYVAAAGLYREMALVEKAAVATSDPALGKQLDKSGIRLRVLADRVYDRGRLTLDPRFFDPPGESVQISRPTDVPDWEAEGHSAGPPLDDEAPPHSGNYPQRSVFRSKGPVEDWIKAVTEADVPTAQELMAAVHTTDGKTLQAYARRLQAAAKALDEVPDPDEDHGRERAATARLALLVSAEGARLAQAALLLPAGPKAALAPVADRLLFIAGDMLWDSELPQRRSGLDDGVMDVAVPEVGPLPTTTTTATTAPG